MRLELDHALCAKYPKIFKNPKIDIGIDVDTDIGLGWGLDVGDGWYHVINNGCSLIQHHIDYQRQQRARALRYNRAIRRAKNGDTASLRKIYADTNGTLSSWRQGEYDNALISLDERPVPVACPQVIATQVKEKFGSLRFYYQGGDEYVSGVTNLMSAMSDTTCDNCGAIGAKGGKGWLSVKCAPCRLGFEQSLPDYGPDVDD